VVLEGITFRNGRTSEASGGGAICELGGLPTIRNCIFVGNQAPSGGAFSSNNPYFTTQLEDCIFLNNGPSLYGGAVSCKLDQPYQYALPSLTRCTFSGNTAGLKGGAIYCLNGQMVMDNCTITKSAVIDAFGYGGAIDADGVTNLIMSNTIIAYNRASNVGGVRVPYALVTCCDAYENVGGDWGGIADPTGQDGNISLNPLFCDFDNRDVHLHADSPCAPFSPTNPQCDLIGAWPVACVATTVGAGAVWSGSEVQVLPNPSSGSCRIVFRATAGGEAVASIVDPAGRIVRRLVAGADGGTTRTLFWDGRDERGGGVPSGVYWVRTETSSGTQGRRLIVMK
jgi:predicted outer membrane repeat protein